jgi:thymine-DNA glycosylase
MKVEDGPDAQAEDRNLESPLNHSPSFSGRLDMSTFAFKPQKSLPGGDSTSSHPKDLISNSKGIPLSTNLGLGTKRKASNMAFSPSKTKKHRSPPGYAPPSKYAHLPLLPDVIIPGLICIFVGLNPGIETATRGHAYAHPSNLFWKLLHSSGCTTRRCQPQEDRDLPRLFLLGNTNIVERPTRNGAELSKAEMDASVKVLEEKIRKFKPEAVCMVGKSIWESVWRVRYGKPIKKEEFKYGWQDEGENMGRDVDDEWKGAKVFAATSTSGLAASLSPTEKESIWKELGVWVERRRKERGFIPDRPSSVA